MGQEMSAPGLLAEGKHRPDQQGAGERDPCEPRSRLPPDEVERHEGEASRSMRTRKASGARQAVGAVLKQSNVGVQASEAGKSARAVHVCRQLEKVHDCRA
jgi:hypothetical protein